ncbi:MAG TPA: hypothetical protein ENJ52_06715 [Aliiroseovarius sp.]|nr:hypothetical protein [Aliiroseovarius sp.]
MIFAKLSLAAPVLLALALPARAGIPEIEAVRATPQGESWNFAVTLSHPDTGWDHYADAWEVLDADGNVLGQRILVHPHVNEQPFTRSLGGVAVPAGTTRVFLRARCTVDGWGQTLFPYDLPE